MPLKYDIILNKESILPNWEPFEIRLSSDQFFTLNRMTDENMTDAKTVTHNITKVCSDVNS